LSSARNATPVAASAGKGFNCQLRERHIERRSENHGRAQKRWPGDARPQGYGARCSRFIRVHRTACSLRIWIKSIETYWSSWRC